MEPVQITNEQSVSITESAVDAVLQLMAQRNLSGYALRVYISGGGCSGLQYGLAFDNNIRSEDTISEINSLKVLVDEVSIQYLQGATVDYITSPEGAGFKISNPNVIPSCNCSSSQTDNGGGCSGCG